MGKKILRVYLAKNDTPYSAAYAKAGLAVGDYILAAKLSDAPAAENA